MAVKSFNSVSSNTAIVLNKGTLNELDATDGDRYAVTFRYIKCIVPYLKAFQGIGQQIGNNNTTLRETA
jgi:hypothetical protein